MQTRTARLDETAYTLRRLLVRLSINGMVSANEDFRVLDDNRVIMFFQQTCFRSECILLTCLYHFESQ